MADATPRIRIDIDAHRAWIGDQSLKLTPKEFAVLAYLASNVGKAVRREELMGEVWGSRYGDSKTLDMHIAWLRRKLGDDPKQPRYVTTIRSVGFRLEPGTLAEDTETVTVQPTRVLLVRPGDALIIGNVGTIPERVAATAAALRDQLQLSAVVLFAGDIDMAAVSKGAL
ncbi:winged helix-turn-helix domain-containing protein [Thermoactinospora rubra]|uniref:winged helix-turn-helix domain-containing protein n=1 Tax=Thermoactinospora rubra TaxID=1088767 RepID=UPI000A103122|nr:winged helix-turn-helix domain-containing protein [Thermoactinospora rubra]